MSSVLLFCFLSMLPNQVDIVHLALPPHSSALIKPYRNNNFSQKVQIYKGKLYCRVETRDFHPLAKPHRVMPDPDYIENLPPKTAELTLHLLAGSDNLSEYIDSCSNYLKKNIRYRETESSDDLETIVRSGSANCIGYCSLFHHFLRAGRIKSRICRGFFLFTEKNKRIRLIPHRWIEIILESGERIFFDPQYQSFTACYLKTDDDIDFTKIKVFGGLLIKRNQRLSNQEGS